MLGCSCRRRQNRPACACDFICSLFPLPRSLSWSWPTSYTVDALNRTANKIFIDGTRVTSTWDSASQQITSQDVTGITSYVWDLDSRKIATQYPTAVNLTNTLDAVGNRVVLADPLGLTTYTWDIQSRLTEVVNALNEATSIQWDPLN